MQAYYLTFSRSQGLKVKNDRLGILAKGGIHVRTSIVVSHGYSWIRRCARASRLAFRSGSNQKKRLVHLVEFTHSQSALEPRSRTPHSGKETGTMNDRIAAVVIIILLIIVDVIYVTVAQTAEIPPEVALGISALVIIGLVVIVVRNWRHRPRRPKKPRPPKPNDPFDWTGTPW